MVIFDQFITSLLSLIEVLSVLVKPRCYRLQYWLSGQVEKENTFEDRIFAVD